MSVTEQRWPWLYEPSNVRPVEAWPSGLAIPAVWTNAHTGVQVFVNIRDRSAAGILLEVIMGSPALNHQLIDMTPAIAGDLMQIDVKTLNGEHRALANEVRSRVWAMVADETGS